MKQGNKKGLILIMVILSVISMGIWIMGSNTTLEVNEYLVTSKRIPEALSGFRIAQVSDLHNVEFDEGNSRLINLLSQTEPDVIVITGDLIDSRNTDIKIALEFAVSAMEIAPVYYVTGNHEARISEYEKLKIGLEEAGVIVLKNEKVRIEQDGAYMTLMGIDDPSFTADYLFGDARSVIATTLSKLKDESDGYSVLLSHRPELFDVYAEYGIDLVFSGHAHGGQFRLPIIGGLFAPNQGFLPHYDAGMFYENSTAMIVSRGIGNSIIPFRINNCPEIVICDLVFTET